MIKKIKGAKDCLVVIDYSLCAYVYSARLVCILPRVLLLLLMLLLGLEPAGAGKCFLLARKIHLTRARAPTVVVLQHKSVYTYAHDRESEQCTYIWGTSPPIPPPLGADVIYASPTPLTCTR